MKCIARKEEIGNFCATLNSISEHFQNFTQQDKTQPNFTQLDKIQIFTTVEMEEKKNRPR